MGPPRRQRRQGPPRAIRPAPWLTLLSEETPEWPSCENLKSRALGQTLASSRLPCLPVSPPFTGAGSSPASSGPCGRNLGSLRLQLCAEALRPPGSWSPETGMSQELMCRPVRRWGTAPGSDGHAPLPTRYAAHPTGSRLVTCSLDVQRENDPFLLRSCSSSPAAPTHAGPLKVIVGWTHLGTSAGCPRLGPSAPAFPFHILVSRKIPF